MRTYGHYCGLAKALDVIGDRWNLLIVRELMTRKRARFTDLRNGLPGIASNLLADRLRELEAAGVVSRVDAPPPIATALFALTARGEALRPAIRELGRWGAQFLAGADPSDDAQLHWLGLPAELSLIDAAPHAAEATLQITSGDEDLSLHIGGGAVRASIGRAERPDATLKGPVREIARILLSPQPKVPASKRGVSFSGDPRVLERLRPL